MSQLSKHLLPVNKELKRKLWPENFQEELKMNERIKELAEQAGIVFWEMSGDVDWRQANREHLEEFAELIVKECIDQGKQVQSQTVSNGSEDYNNGRKMGIEVFMNQIKKHFRGEE